MGVIFSRVFQGIALSGMCIKGRSLAEAQRLAGVVQDDTELLDGEKVVDIPSSPELGTSDDEAGSPLIGSGAFSDRTAAILDWDDTVCPSTHLASLGLRVDDRTELPEDLRQQLDDLETAAIGILKEALRFGTVIVITNAEAGWVEMSGRKFLPRVVEFLEMQGIKIVSARSLYECEFPDSPANWKVAAFTAEMAQLFPMDDDLNVLVLGDSMSERDAAHALGDRLPASRIKTVKFVERPSIDQLQRQIELVQASYQDLCEYTSSFDVNLTLTSPV